MNKLYVIKLVAMCWMTHVGIAANFPEDFAAIQELKILIHGVEQSATKLVINRIESKYVKGRRITDALPLAVTMVYGGLLNKQLVAQLQQMNCNAMGFTGADGNLIKTVKRPVKDVDYGYVGDITQRESVNSWIFCWSKMWFPILLR